jgi:hypothetical protein
LTARGTAVSGGTKLSRRSKSIGGRVNRLIVHQTVPRDAVSRGRRASGSRRRMTSSTLAPHTCRPRTGPPEIAHRRVRRQLLVGIGADQMDPPVTKTRSPRSLHQGSQRARRGDHHAACGRAAPCVYCSSRRSILVVRDVPEYDAYCRWRLVLPQPGGGHPCAGGQPNAACWTGWWLMFARAMASA